MELLQRLFTGALRRANPGRGGHPGQSIVILAMGFIGLVGFVGIVTDVSVLLIRYSTLTRALDSAAIAASSEWRAEGDLNRTYAEMNIAARQMIELHGISPDIVRVDTCESTKDRMGASPELEEINAFLCRPGNATRKLVMVSAKVSSPTLFMRVLGWQEIVLEASALSETAVLDVVIVMDVSESMLHDTTYEDWAKIGLGKVYVPPHWQNDVYATEDAADGSADGVLQSMLGKDPAKPGKPAGEIPDIAQIWRDDFLLPHPQEVSLRLMYPDAGDVAGINGNEAAYTVDTIDHPTAPVGGGAHSHPRENCRVRFWPYSTAISIPDHIWDLPGYQAAWSGSTNQYAGFAPAFDFYGCCNDPTSGGTVDEDYNLTALPGNTLETNGFDNNFSDLICQPFKQARDATRLFVDRIDFASGDRVAFVTFDRGAFIVDPDGSTGGVEGSELCDSEAPATPGGTTQAAHMITCKARALATLDKDIGVRAEPNFYEWKEDGGGWVGYAAGFDENGDPRQVDYYPAPGQYSTEAANNARNTYPLRDNCPYQNAALGGFFSLYSLWDWTEVGKTVNPENWMMYYGSGPEPGLVRTMNPNLSDAGWAATDITYLNSYELWASCRGTNFGAALREANNAFVDPRTIRRDGAVWVMVMLSDGAAGASDPVRINGTKAVASDPYFDRGPNPSTDNWAEWPSGSGQELLRFGTGGDYGAFGLCPMGTPSQPGQLTRDRAQAVFPFCSDEDPASRHFCTPQNDGDLETVGYECDGGGSLDGTGRLLPGFAPGSRDGDYECEPPLADADLDGSGDLNEGEKLTYNVLEGNVYDVDIGVYGQVGNNCDLMYDVDDYARDWADFIALSETGGGSELLPTIYTIGFGLNYLTGSSGGSPGDESYVPGTAAENVPDHLGEELLRYIADVGDDNELDTDYQQDYLDNGLLDGSADFGLRGKCETSDGAQNEADPLPPRVDCGNYYNAPNQDRLAQVFDDIASRMFTRLAP